jgi:hypothetical protein
VEQTLVRLNLTGWELVEHVEGEHERDMGGCLTFDDVRRAHRAMHANRRDWNHKHSSKADHYD